MQTAEKKTFYRRVLPDVCVAFSSERGKQLFTDALATGYMNCYFTLASQFRTQDEPSYCGLSSLVMVLNALAIDPGKLWKGVFRWYHEDMLDCCTPIDEVKKNGISSINLLCLALCNQLHGEFKRATDEVNIDEFRQELKFSTKREDRAIILSYGRQVLGQTGSGHFSPVGGYNELEDMVLILDVARFKYPPYWVSVQKVWEAMNTLDTVSGLTRGYMVLWRADSTTMPDQPPLLFKVSQRLNASHSILEESGSLIAKIETFLSESAPSFEDDALKEIITTLLTESYSNSKDNGKSSFLTVRLTSDQITSEFSDQQEAIEQLIQAIEETYICKKINQMYPNGICCQQALFITPDESPVSSQTSCCIGPDNTCKICLKHFLTVFILSFPMGNRHICTNKPTDKSTSKEEITYRTVLNRIVDRELACHKMSGSPTPQHRVLLLNEVKQLRKQFDVLMRACR